MQPCLYGLNNQVPQYKHFFDSSDMNFLSEYMFNE